jgi:hypothetical protein
MEIDSSLFSPDEKEGILLHKNYYVLPFTYWMEYILTSPIVHDKVK